MEPTIKVGQRVLVFQWAYLFGEPNRGDIVIFKRGKEYWVKRITEVFGRGVKVTGDNKEDSLEVGEVDKKDIIGKVILL